jgi:hypothetical protein
MALWELVAISVALAALDASPSCILITAVLYSLVRDE